MAIPALKELKRVWPEVRRVVVAPSGIINLLKSPELAEEWIAVDEKDISLSEHLVKNAPEYLCRYEWGIEFFEGKEGLKKVMDDSLTASETIYSYVDFETIAKHIPDINKQYRKRIRRNVGICRRRRTNT